MTWCILKCRDAAHVPKQVRENDLNKDNVDLSYMPITFIYRTHVPDDSDITYNNFLIVGDFILFISYSFSRVSSQNRNR